MLIKAIAETFAQAHKIELTQRRLGFIGRKDRLVIGYWNNGLRDTLFVSKSFPPLEATHESKVFIRNDVQPDLKLEILYGCLEDYIVPLDNAMTELCGVVQQILIDSYLALGDHPQPPASISYHQLPIVLPDHETDLLEILLRFYPYQ